MPHREPITGRLHQADPAQPQSRSQHYVPLKDLTTKVSTLCNCANLWSCLAALTLGKWREPPPNRRVALMSQREINYGNLNYPPIEDNASKTRELQGEDDH